MQVQEIRGALAEAQTCGPLGASVLIPLIEEPQGLGIVLEVRALTLEVQPGEVCLPGGRIEPGESPQEAALRETCEELLVEPRQIELLGALGLQLGPGGMPLHVFVGALTGYRGTFSTDEVDRTFSLPLDWLLTHDPHVFEVTLEPHYPADYPWDLIPGGRRYPWRAQRNRVPFYLGTDPLVWGATARVLDRFARLLKHVRMPR